MADNPDEAPPPPDAVVAATDQPIAIIVRQITDDRVPDGMSCLATYLHDHLVARCAVPPEAIEFFERHAIFAEPRQLVLAAREASPGLQCELYALIPMPEELILADEPDEPWAASVPSSDYERVVSGEAADDADGTDPRMAAVLLGSIVRFARDRRHPESLQLEAVDVLSRIVSGRVVEAVDRALEDLLGS